MLRVAIITIVLALMTSVATSFTAARCSNETNFKAKTEAFLKKFEADFEKSSERHLNAKYNDRTLETETTSAWSKTLTLKSKKTFKNHYKQTVRQRLYLGFHDFESNKKCNEAFKKVMTCLGTDCQKVEWGDNKTSIKSTPFIYIKTERQIIFCKISCEHENDFWTTFKEQLLTEFKTDKYKAITVGCGGSLTFEEAK